MGSAPSLQPAEKSSCPVSGCTVKVQVASVPTCGQGGSTGPRSSVLPSPMSEIGPSGTALMLAANTLSNWSISV